MKDLIIIFLLSIFEIFGDFQFQQYVDTNTYQPLFLGIFGYIGVVFFLIKSLRETNILYVNLLWDGMSALIESIAAIVILGQRFKNYKHALGAVFIISGLVLIRAE